MRHTMKSLMLSSSLLLPSAALAADYSYPSSSSDPTLSYFVNNGVTPKTMILVDGNTASGAGDGIRIDNVQYGVYANASSSSDARGGTFVANAADYTTGVEVGSYGTTSSYNRAGNFSASGYDYSANYGVIGYASGGDYSSNYGIYGSAFGGTGAYDRAGYFNGDVALYNIDWLSDQRFKKNVQDVSGGLKKVMALKPRGYEYKTEEYKGRMNLSKGKRIGFIAQELEQVLPELVHDQKTPVFLTAEEKKNKVKKEAIEYKSVDYVGVIPVLVKAVQEQQAMIESMRAEIASLKAAK